MISVYAFYKLINLSVDLSIIYSGISPNGIKNGCPYWYIVCGLTPESYGLYNTKYAYIINYTDPNEQLEVFKRIMNEITQDKSFMEILTFFAKKEYIMWGEIHNCAKFNSSTNIPHIVYNIFDYLNHLLYILVLLLTTLGMKKKQFHPAVVFLSVLFLGFFFVFIIKEINPVYRYSTILILSLASATGIDALLNSNWMCRKKEIGHIQDTPSNTCSK